jgi:hypothetical protein
MFCSPPFVSKSINRVKVFLYKYCFGSKIGNIITQSTYMFALEIDLY